ncbi:MAG: PEP-CTERM sorting domain-containing protein [Pseudomonadota bacterium]
MKKYSVFLCSLIAGVLIFSSTCLALNYGTNITIWDGMGTNGEKEDGTTEPGCTWGQDWDLEGFFLDDWVLTMVGGYDFVAGNSNIYSGDLFIDINGDAKYGTGNVGGGSGNVTTAYNFGYDYVFDLDFTNLSYAVYKLSESATVILNQNVYYSGNIGSNPWRYESGGTYVTGGTFGYLTGQADNADSNNILAGGYHNVATFDLSFLNPGTEFTTHFTMGCGNDNLMGAGQTPVPEPSTMILMGLGILGLAGLKKKRAVR